MTERRELTAEERQKLAGYLPFNNESTIEFTPPTYLCKDGDEETAQYLIPDGYRPVFLIKPLAKAEYDKAVRVQLDCTKGITMLERQQGIRDIVNTCITGWSDFYDIGAMQEIEYKNTLEILNKIPFPVIVDIFMYVLKMSGLLPGEKLGLK